jgi:hypothetical protein
VRAEYFEFLSSLVVVVVVAVVVVVEAAYSSSIRLLNSDKTQEKVKQ